MKVDWNIICQVFLLLVFTPSSVDEMISNPLNLQVSTNLGLYAAYHLSRWPLHFVNAPSCVTTRIAASPASL
jgi:hypothetical protein